MATLNGGISSTAELIRVSGALPPAGSYVTIDSEALRINGAARGANGRSFTRDYLAVDRGVAGTTKATHSNGATLTRYYPEAEGGGGGGGVTVTGSQGGSVSGATEFRAAGTVTDLGGGVAGQGLVVQQLGPFHVDIETVGFVNPDSGNGVELATVPVEAMVYVIAIASETFDQPGVLDVVLAVDVDTPGASLIQAGPIAVSPGGPDILREIASVSGNTVIHRPLWGFAVTGGALFAAYYPDADDPTEGAVDIYAIIATPAS